MAPPGGPKPKVVVIRKTIMELTLVTLACAIVVTWVLSLITRNYSWVDRLWSIIPIVYLGMFAWESDGNFLRRAYLFILVAAWGIRLTFNFNRKGGYSFQSEDYRWAELRKIITNSVAWELFNLVFIHVYQNVLLYLIALPAKLACQSHGEFSKYDGLLFLAAIAFVVGETVADQQQWNFHQQKYALIRSGKPVKEKFLTRGLFAYSRHPNFFCEQAFWVTIYGFSLQQAWFNYTAVGPILLILLFHGSTMFTEGITVKKYPEYADYQKSVSRLVPMFKQGQPKRHKKS